MTKDGRWSRKWLNCQRCGGTDSPYGSRGLCKRCESFVQYRLNNGVPLESPKFARPTYADKAELYEGLIDQDFLDFMLGRIPNEMR